MSALHEFAVIATKLSTGAEVVFAVAGDAREASLLSERLVHLGLPTRVQQVRANTAWAGQNWLRNTPRE